MGDGSTNLFGIVIPSTNPVFLTVVGVHILLGLACTVTGAAAMLSQKRRGRHPRYGTIYYWCLAGVFLTAASLAAVRWAEDYHVFILGALSMAAAHLGRGARRYRWRSWVRLHITGMGASYVLLLIAFYVDNGHRSEEHTSELQSLRHLVCRLLLEKNKKQGTSLVNACI